MDPPILPSGISITGIFSRRIDDEQSFTSPTWQSCPTFLFLPSRRYRTKWLLELVK